MAQGSGPTAPDAPSSRLAAGLHELSDLVATLAFRVPGEGHDERLARRDRVVRTVDDYLLPRLASLGAPLVAVLVGSTGAGKSTIVNGLAQASVTRPGATRPTTRAPLVWTATDQADRYGTGFLTGYALAGAGDERPLEVVGSDDPLLDGLTIVDTPDIDSVEIAHHQVAADLLAVADVVVYVTSAQRYADAVPWQFLAEVRRRGTPTSFVMNRVPPGRAEEIVADFRARLVDQGVADRGVAVLALDEQPVDPVHGGLPPDSVAPLREALAALADPAAREASTRTAMAGALAAALDDADAVARDLAAERSTVTQLVESAQAAYAAQVAELSSSLRDGSLIRGEVLRRWQEFVGTGDLLRAVSGGVGRVMSLAGRLIGRRPPTEVVEEQARDELVSAVLHRVQRAVADVSRTWEMTEPGRALLATAAGAGYRTDPETMARAQAAVGDWTAQLAQMVEEEGEGRKRIAQAASLGVNAVAVTALITTFGATGGLSGAEVGITTGAAAVQQSVLEHAFGSAAARTLVSRARGTLEQTLAAVVSADAERYRVAAEQLTVDAATVTRLRTHVEEVRVQGRAAGLLDRRGRPVVVTA